MSQPRDAQVGQQREQVRLRAGDAGHLLGVQDDHSAVTTRADLVGPVLDRVARLDPLAQLAAERVPVDALERAQLLGELGRRRRGAKRSSGGSRSSKPVFEASTGMPVAAAS